uniref:X-ray radiation resistance-associated protein 1 n=1 Tax=Scatophagus argus TaxID=75038 RepID=UPI001ED83795|nr:X-ray radiation resistance-associated protein 1 [Scatophagus argus]
MTAESHKFDYGQSNPTKCFRTLLHRRKEGAGHWLVAYREAEQLKYRNLHQRIRNTYRKCENNRRAAAPHGNTLDGPLLLRLHCVDKPSDLCSVDISEQQLNSVKPENLKVFENVAYINASINYLSLESFSSFVSLRELNLSLNRLSSLTFYAADFPHLEVLDLSYNSLSADDIMTIGELPHLKVLHLTGNELRHIPPNLGSSNHDATQLPPKDEDALFKALEVLELDDNKLSSGIFISLKDFKRLKCLNLQGNCISEIPYLQLIGSSKPLQTSTEDRAEEAGLASTKPNPDTAEHVKRLSQIFYMQNWEENGKGFSWPLPELQFLNLADNKIAEEEALMASTLFPMLREIDICANPLTTQRSGDLPLLTHYLQERLGITIKRKKMQEVVKLKMKVSTDPKWKVEERTAKASEKLLMMDAPRPAQAEKNEPAVRCTAESEGKKSRDDTLQENTERVFLTQALELDLQADEKETAEKKDKNKTDPIHVKLTDYEILMDAKPNPDAAKPIGIQTAVQMLEHTLRNLNVYSDSKPKLDCIQTPYREREKKIKELPPLKPVKQPAERVDEVIREIKESTTITQVSLSTAVHSTGVSKQEALLLLRDMKAKYKMVCKRTAEQTASFESHRKTNQNGAETPPVQTL